MKKLCGVFMFTIAMFLPFVAAAADITISQTLSRNTVQVICADRQGSGALVHNGVDGVYILTAGHVPINEETRVQAGDCQVGFVPDAALPPKTFFRASVVHAIFDLRTDRDFAILKVEEKIFGGSTQIPTTPFKTNEFATPGDAVVAFGFPSRHDSKMEGSSGHILVYSRGTLRSDAPISPGFSGGPVLDVNGNIVGVASRINTSIDDQTGTQIPIDYEMGDVLSLFGWLDSFGPAEHDKFFSHADVLRFEGAPYVARNEEPGCAYVVRTKISPTVYCLLQNAYRLVFPNQSTLASWFPKSAIVAYVAPTSLAEYRLIGNMTMRAGTLVKIQTDPKVYVVTDSFGTLRWVPTEDRARALFGDGWRTLVRDVPDVFFTDYHIGQPLF